MLIEVLGQFKPSSYELEKVDLEFTEFLRTHGYKPRERQPGIRPQIGVRLPADTVRACEKTPVLMEWHRDGAGPEPTREDVTPSVKVKIVWSNGSLTEFSKDKQEVIRMNPGDVVLFDNVNVWHRSPQPEHNRYFIEVDDPLSV